MNRLPSRRPFPLPYSKLKLAPTHIKTFLLESMTQGRRGFGGKDTEKLFPPPSIIYLLKTETFTNSSCRAWNKWIGVVVQGLWACPAAGETLWHEINA